MKNRKLSELVLDYTIYPRASVDAQHARYIRAAIESGAEMPPLIICGKTLRIIDGFHRYRAYGDLYGTEHEVACIEKRYKNDSEAFLDCVRYNAAHGRNLSTYDRAHCVTICDTLHVADELIAGALQLTVDAVGELRTGRIGKLRVKNTMQPVALKRTIQHMAGKTLTAPQEACNKKLGGMQPAFYANQLLMLIENDLLPDDDQLRALLGRLHDAIERHVHAMS